MLHVMVKTEHNIKVLEQSSQHIDGPKGAAAMLMIKPSTLRSRMSLFALAFLTAAALYITCGVAFFDIKRPDLVLETIQD